MSIIVANHLAERSLIENGYTIKNTVEVFDFLAANPFLEPILVEASQQLEPFFPRSKPGLELHQDPEGEGEAKLVGYISPYPFPQAEAFARLIKFRQDW